MGDREGGVEDRKTLHTESRLPGEEKTSSESHRHGLESCLHFPAEQITWTH